MTLPVSLLVITKDEERHIQACLDSAPWVAEKVVIDSGSTDATVRLAEEAGARVLQHPFTTHATQKNWGLEQVSERWVLCLDADERAGKDMEEAVRKAMGDTAAAWRMPRRNWLLDGFVRHGSWSRDRVVRLLDRERARFDEDRLVHESVVTDGWVGDLRAPILHYTCLDMEPFLHRADSYARLGARQEARKGNRASWRKLLLRPISRFLRSYLLLWGFLDGRRGIVQAGMAAIGAWLKYVYLWEMEVGEESGAGERAEEGADADQ